MNKIAGRSAIALLLALALLFGFFFFVWEFGKNAADWVLFPGSPHVYLGGNLGCGTVTDRAGNLLLSLSDGRQYATDALLRKATVHWLGDRKGSVTAPALSYYASQIVSFDLLNGVYVYGSTGSRAELTLSADIQKAALEAMGSYSGTVAVYNYKTGEILCAVSSATFDPDEEITEVKEGMYLNRFTQGLYTPGSIFKIVTLAAALEENPQLAHKSFTCEGKIAYGIDTVTCTRTHGTQNLQTAFRNSCNCAFAQIAGEIGWEKLADYAEKFQITKSVAFDGITTAEGKFDIQNEAAVNVAWSAIGQFTDLINPCRFLAFVGAIAAGGQGKNPYLVSEVVDGNREIYSAEAVMGDRIMSTETAEILCRYLRSNVQDKYGDGYFKGLNVCAKTGTAEVGSEKKPNAMLTGFVADNTLPLAFIVCVEDGGTGREICLPIASKVLEACKKG